ncbi:MAG TPA: hypothetical protein VFG76_09575 [Candidatus Polarisedimenticolia bacterium]|nr:hypothetical protein [Candidatus Polarisedimenticolia bacterium]
MKTPGRLFCLGSVLLASALVAIAQPPEFYALRKDSAYESGCFSPCMCPILVRGPLRGGFRLTFTGSDPLFDHYAVDQLKWVVREPSGDLHATGSGTYKVGGQFARQQQLSLDLEVDGNPVQHFDSGLVTTSSIFPAIDARISINGEYCHDTVFDLHARPVREIDVSGASIYWSNEPTAGAHDVVWGSLSALLASRGDYQVAVRGCLANDVAGDSVPLTAPDPAPGDGFFFLLRDIEPSMPDSFDSGSPAQFDPSDDAIGASPARCP